MQTYMLISCKISSVELPLDLANIGFEPDSLYCLYFLDHAKEQDDANVLELSVIPFVWTDIAQIYSLTIRLKNVPHATAHAVEVLYSNNIDIKITSATDSIAGKKGSLETIVCSPNLGLEQIDALFCEAYEQNRNHIRDFVEPTGYETGLGTTEEGRYIGRFIVGTKFLKNAEEFYSKVVTDGKARLKKSDGKLILELPTDFASNMVSYLNEKYGKPKDALLSDYSAALTVNTSFNNLSISFLNPNEAIVQINMIVYDRKGVFNAISDFLGRKQVNFRIVQLKNIEIGKRMKIELKCDIGACDYQLYSLRTLRRTLLIDLQAVLEDQPGGSAEYLIDLQVNSLYGYPKKLRNFGERDLFDLIEVFYLKSGQVVHRLIGPDESTDEMVEIDTAKIAEIWTRTEDEAAFENELKTYFLEQGAYKVKPTFLTTVSDTQFKHVQIKVDTRSYWLHLNKHNALALVFDNVPPVNLAPKFFDANLLRRGDNVKKKVFDVLCRELLHGLSYNFPTQAEFSGFGQKPAALFADSANERFSALGPIYIQEKYNVDEFPVKGNHFLSLALRSYLQDCTLPATGNLTLLDIGPGAGALTTLFAIRELASLGLLEKVPLSITLLDISKGVLECCKSGNFLIPEELRDEYFAGFDLDLFRKILRQSETVEADITTVFLTQKYDVILSGFAFHHMNNESRRTASHRMYELAKPGGFIGLVDESMSYPQYLEYLMNHVGDRVSPALESFISDPEEHVTIFKQVGANVKVFKHDRFYYLCGIKQVALEQAEMAPRSQSTTSRSTATKRPSVVIFSSTEGLQIAKLIQTFLNSETEAIVWDQGEIFALGSVVIESLEKAVSTYDFAIFVFTPDDKLDRRGETYLVARDNLIFELGLFVGKRTRSRAFVVRPRGMELALPSDLQGLVMATFDVEGGSLEAALGPVCEQIREAINKC